MESLACVAVGKEIYSFGGWNENDKDVQNGDIWVFVFDTGTLEWQQLEILPSDYPKYDAKDKSRNEIPHQRHGHSVCTWNGKIYLWGGEPKLGKVAHLHEFNPTTKRWFIVSPTGTLPASRSGHSLTVVGNRMYLRGGQPEGRMTLYCFNFPTKAWSKLADSALYRIDHTAHALKNKLYIVGGHDNYGDAHKDKAEVFDLMLRKWLQPIRTDTPSAR